MSFNGHLSMNDRLQKSSREVCTIAGQLVLALVGLVRFVA